MQLSCTERLSRLGHFFFIADCVSGISYLKHDAEDAWPSTIPVFSRLDVVSSRTGIFISRPKALAWHCGFKNSTISDDAFVDQEQIDRQSSNGVARYTHEASTVSHA